MFTSVRTVQSPRRRAAFGLSGLVATGALALSLAFGGVAALPALADEAASAPAVTAAQIDGDITLAERVAAEVLPSVGSVYCVVGSGFYSGISQGSCEVLSADGYILTNYHVIEGSNDVQVVLQGDVYVAEIVGSDPTSDLAVLKIEPGDEPLTPIKIGDSSTVRAGQWVMTVGTPYGERETVSQGIVSGTARTASVPLEMGEAYYVGLIQSDAMINSGSSGGAMVNANGELIGVTTLSGSQSGDWAGMTYAIPSNYAIDIAQQLIENGVAQHPQIGVSVVSILEAMYQGYYNQPSDSSVFGAYVAAVSVGSGANEAGIQPGDIITHVDGTKIEYANDLIIGVRTHAIGDTVTLTVERAGETLEIDVVLGSDADNTGEMLEAEAPDAPIPSRPGFGGWGFDFGFSN